VTTDPLTLDVLRQQTTTTRGELCVMHIHESVAYLHVSVFSASETGG